MANLVSISANLVLTTLFYAPLLPIGIPIALIGMTFAYWVDKYNLLRIHRVPEMLNGVLPLFLSNVLPYIAFLWSLIFFFTVDILLTYHEGNESYRDSEI